MKRLLTTSGIITITVSAFALSSFVGTLSSAYGLKADGTVAKSKCAACHMSKGGGKLNAYGLDLKAVMNKASTKKLTSEILHGIDGKDSDKDGTSNGDELKADRLPGSAG